MHTSMKTWSLLSNYKGVCSVFLWGCPAALLTLWGLCFSRFLPPTLLPPSLLFSPTLFFRICTPHNPCSFLPPNWRACLFYLFICFSPPFSFILSSFFLTFPPPLPLTRSLSQFICVLHCVAVWIWTVCCVNEWMNGMRVFTYPELHLSLRKEQVTIVAMLQLYWFSHKTTVAKCSIMTAFWIKYMCRVSQRTTGAWECGMWYRVIVFL